jgi:hypothetical protein
MASIGTVYVKVKPDLSAFTESITAELITELLSAHLLRLLPRNAGRADLRVVAAALLDEFTILPKD